MSRILHSLLAEGVVKLQHNYLSGTILDHSGNDNHGTMTDTLWTNDGISFPGSSSLITVADHASLQLTEGYIGVLADFESQVDSENLVQKKDVGGTNYQVYLASGYIKFYDGASVVKISTDVRRSKYLGINFKDSEIPNAYLDTKSIGNLDGSVAISTDDAPLSIGNLYSGGDQLLSRLKAVIIVSRKLTDTESSLLYADLADLESQTAVQSISYGNIGINVEDSDLIAAYNMHPIENEVADVSSNGWDGIVHGAAQENTVLGSSIRFDGVSHHIDLQTLASTSGTYTFSMWLKTDMAATITQYIFDTQNGRFVLGLFTGTSGQIGFTTAGWQSFGTAPNDGLWHHIVYLFDGVGGTGKLYIDGVQLGTSKSYTAANIGTQAELCADYNGTNSFVECNLINFAIYDTVKSTDWIQAEYEKGLSAGWKTEFGAFVSPATRTSGYLENTPFQIDSGSFIVSTDIIRAKLHKTIACVTDGIIYIPSSWFQQTPREAAYGRWEFWYYKDSDADYAEVGILSSDSDALKSGYSLTILGGNSSNRRFYCREWDSGGSSTNRFYTAADHYTPETWIKFSILRSRLGLFTFYSDDVVIDTTGGTGSNPFTDTTFTTSKYLVAKMYAGDKLSLGNISGNGSIFKGVLS